MALSLEEMSDRFELQDLCFQYADIIDRCAFDELKNVFTHNAHIDYSAMGGSVGNLNETIEFLKMALPGFSAFQHLNANLQFTIDGDTATGRIMCFNPMEITVDNNNVHSFMLGLWYVDKYVRTADGWRIQERSEEKSWMLNEPEMMKSLRSQSS